ncbi:MAG: cyclopropane fatty acyl phospholipid synthase [Gammaproteobacteria bacterium]|nr:cyclopropane fatty acyl phospholipid synthase [Gammaproteobacteria bacterium]
MDNSTASEISSRTQGSSDFRLLEELLLYADIRINGSRPWDIQIHSPVFPRQVFSRGSLGLGEAYIDGLWDVESLDSFFFRVLRAQLDRQIAPIRLALHALRAHILNLQTVRRAWQVGEAHYDLGNDFYRAMLDDRMTYTCGYWKNATTLEQAQEHKLELVCRKLGLRKGMRVLDIGCGWGSFMKFAAERYGVECVGVTISRAQAEYGQRLCAGLPIEFRLQDYRSMSEQFDRVVSIGMFEHVGRKNHREYMEVVRRSLKDDGLFLLHTIGKNNRKSTPDPWIDKYIFPNGDLPSLGQIGDAVDALFVIEDVHNFGADYDKTLMAWYRNFDAARPSLAAYGERFHRMWRYYLLSCAGAFRARDIQLWQVVLSKRGVHGGYVRHD